MERWHVDPLDYHEVHRCRAKFSAWLGSHVNKSNPIFEYELVFGELVTNAVRYGSSPVHVEVQCDAKQLLISVEDFGACFDLEMDRKGPAFSEGGRGLDIVKQLATHVNVSDGHDNPCRVEARMALIA